MQPFPTCLGAIDGKVPKTKVGYQNLAIERVLLRCNAYCSAHILHIYCSICALQCTGTLKRELNVFFTLAQMLVQ